MRQFDTKPHQHNQHPSQQQHDSSSPPPPPPPKADNQYPADSAKEHPAERPLQRLIRLKRIASKTFNIYISLFSIQLFRYILIEVMALELFQDYQLIDCFNLGRFRFVGRTNKISGRIVLVFIATLMFYRLITFKLVPEFRFQAIEFLLYDYETVVAHDIESRANERRVQARSRARDRAHLKPARLSSHAMFIEPPPAGEADEPPFEPDVSFYLRVAHDDSFDDNKSTAARESWILRPNRTAVCWRQLAFYTECVCYGALVFAIAWTVLIYHVVSGSIFTELGYQLSYPSCVSWLQRRQLAAGANLNKTSYKQIYVAPALLAHQMNIADIPVRISLRNRLLLVSGPYHGTRVILDLLENQFWYTDFVLIMTGLVHLIFIASFDVVLNAKEIKRRLCTIVSRLADFHETNRRPQSFVARLNGRPDGRPVGVNERFAYRRYYQSELPNFARRSLDHRKWDEFGVEISNIQTILADHFKLMRAYNKFISFAFGFILSAWLLYTLNLSFWVGSIKNRDLEFEFLVSEVTATFFTVILLSGAAISRSLNYQLYSLIVRAMALDDESSATKMRWTILMKYFSPRPLYCFTLMGSTEISWFFCIQVS